MKTDYDIIRLVNKNENVTNKIQAIFKVVRSYINSA